MNITSNFFTATMKATALKIARMAQTDSKAAEDYCDMHVKQMNDEERKIFRMAIVDAAIGLGG